MSAAIKNQNSALVEDGYAEFETAIKFLETQLSEALLDNVGYHFVHDPVVRLRYAAEIKRVTDDLRHRASSGRITWRQAAQETNELRNTIMEVIRSYSTPVGRAQAEAMKRTGLTLNQMIAKKTLALYGERAQFGKLSSGQQNRVYGEIVKAASQSNPRVNALLRQLSRVGKSLLLASVAISVYQILTSQNKLRTASKEVTITASAIIGGIGGGAIAGLACGPASPVCVTIGAFVGGTLTAFGIDTIWQ